MGEEAAMSAGFELLRPSATPLLLVAVLLGVLRVCGYSLALVKRP